VCCEEYANVRKMSGNCIGYPDHPEIMIIIVVVVVVVVVVVAVEVVTVTVS